MNRSNSHAILDGWTLPSPPSLPLPAWSTLFRLTCDEFIPYARFVGVPAIVAAGAYVAVIDYVAPSMQPLWHLAVILVPLIALTFAFSFVRAWSKWWEDYQFHGFPEKDAEFRRWLTESVPPILAELERDAHASPLSSSKDGHAKHDYEARILRAEPHRAYRAQLSIRSNASPWHRKGEPQEYFRSAWTILEDLDRVVQAGKSLARHQHAPSVQLVTDLRKLAEQTDQPSPVNRCLREVVKAVEYRLAVIRQQEDQERVRQEREAAHANELERRRRQKTEEKDRKEQEAKAAAAQQKAQAALMSELVAFDSLLNEDLAGFRALHDQIRALPSPAHDGMAHDASEWLAEVVQERKQLARLKSKLAKARVGHDLGQMEHDFRALKESDRRSYWRRAQFQATRIHVDPIPLPNYFAGKKAATLVFLKHLNEFALRNPPVRALWRYVDRNGDVCLYYYGPNGCRSPRWQSIHCRITFEDAGHALRIRPAIHIPFGLEGDNSLYDWRRHEGGSAPDGASLVTVTFQRIKKSVDRHDRRSENREVVVDKEMYRLLEGRTDYHELSDADEQTSRHHFGSEANSGFTLKEGRQDSSTSRSGRELSRQQQNKNVRGRRKESLDQGEETAEHSIQITGSHAHEAVEEIEEVESTVVWSMNWDSEELLKRWKENSHNDSADMLDRIQFLITSAIQPLERTAKASGGPLHSSMEDGEFWAQARKLAVLRRDFVAWPFAGTYALRYDGTPRSIPLDPQDPRQLQLPDRSVGRLPDPNSRSPD